MKFFTRGWVHGDMSDDEAEAVVPAYRQHLETIGLSPPARELASLNPHDAHIMDVVHEPSVGTLRIRLRCGDLQTGYFDALLDFAAVTIRPTHVTALVEASRLAEFEILYDEVDRVDVDTFEYRLMLDPVGEVAWGFKDVRIARCRVIDRKAV